MDEAKRLARVSLRRTGTGKERCRDARGTLLWDATLQDLRYAIRQLRALRFRGRCDSNSGARDRGKYRDFQSARYGSASLFTCARSAAAIRTQMDSEAQCLIRMTRTIMNPVLQAKCRALRADVLSPIRFSSPYESKQRSLFRRYRLCRSGLNLMRTRTAPAAVINGEIVSGSFFQTLGVRAVLGRTFNERDDSLSS